MKQNLYLIRLLMLIAIASLAACVTEDPDRQEVSMDDAALLNAQLGIEYMRQGNLKAGQEKIAKALQQNPRTAETQMAAAMLADRLGEDKQAQEHFEKALRYGPNNPDVLNNFAVFLCRKGDKSRGVQYFLRAAASPLYGTPQAAYTNAGYCALADGKSTDAEAYFRQALSYNQNLPGALLPMAEIYHEMGNNLQARAFLQRYLQVGPTDAQVLWLGYRIERAMGDTASAQKYAERLKTEYTTSVQTRDLLRAEQGQR
jgi:type IV pilus assembly protein PilF